MQIFEEVIKPLLQNQVATGLSLTAIFGYVAYSVRQVPSTLFDLLERSFVVKLSATNADPSFIWIELWLASKPYSSRAKSVVLKSYDFDRPAFSDNSEHTVRWELSPGDGFHWFFWKNRLIWLNRSSDTQPGGHSSKGVRTEKIYIYTFGRSQEILREIIREAHATVLQQNMIAIKLWRGYWTNVRGKKPRSLDTIILADGQAKRIVADVQRFMDSREWYAKRGVPWRRGYLFSGPPGTGKTSFVMALAAHFKKTICVLNLGSVDNDSELFSAVMDAPLDSIILIEDIDCAKSSKKRKEDAPLEVFDTPKDPGVPKQDDESSSITKAGLLNALDGVTTPDGRILIMTTNFTELLDDALIRPGRVDVHEVFQFLDGNAQQKMGSIYYDKDLFKPLDFAVSPAELQKAFMLFPSDPGKARDYLESI